MSYCRFSDDDWKSDVYVYESADGFQIHVAANKIIGGIPSLLHAERINIGGIFDGESFTCDSRQSLIEKLEILKKNGYRVPYWVIPDIEEEIKELEKELETEEGVK